MVQYLQINQYDTEYSKRKGKNHMIISIQVNKQFYQIQHLLVIKKTLIKVGIKGIYLNIIGAIYDKLTTTIMLNGEKLKAFPLQSGIIQRYPLTTFI